MANAIRLVASEQELRAMRRRYEADEGLSIRDMAKEKGVSRQTLIRWLKEAGVTRQEISRRASEVRAAAVRRAFARNELKCARCEVLIFERPEDLPKDLKWWDEDAPLDGGLRVWEHVAVGGRHEVGPDGERVLVGALCPECARKQLAISNEQLTSGGVGYASV